MATMAQNDKRLRKAIEAFIEIIRSTEREICDECQLPYSDPLADVRLDTDPESGLLRLTYDGAGYNYFSSRATEEMYLMMRDAAKEFGFPAPDTGKIKSPRDKLDAMLKNLGYYAEDCNTWSMVFVYQGGEKSGRDLPDEREEACDG